MVILGRVKRQLRGFQELLWQLSGDLSSLMFQLNKNVMRNKDSASKGFLHPWNPNIDICRVKQSKDTLKEKKSHKRPVWNIYGMGRGIPAPAQRMVNWVHLGEGVQVETDEWMNEWVNTLHGRVYRWPSPISIFPFPPGTGPQISVGHIATQSKDCNSLPPLQLGVTLQLDCCMELLKFQRGRRECPPLPFLPLPGWYVDLLSGLCPS